MHRISYLNDEQDSRGVLLLGQKVGQLLIDDRADID